MKLVILVRKAVREFKGNECSLCLWNQCHSTSSASIIGQKGSHGDDDQNYVFLGPAPVQRIVSVLARLENENGFSIGSKLESIDETDEGDGYIAFSLAELVEIDFIAGGRLDLL